VIDDAADLSGPLELRGTGGGLSQAGDHLVQAAAVNEPVDID